MIKVEHLHKRFGDFVAVDDVSFEVGAGELVALLGPSGGGKSTILRIIAGLEQADAGQVSLAGEVVDHLHARARRIGFVFQHYALFRHMTVAENIAFGLAVRKAPIDAQQRRVDELLHIIGLNGLGNRYPDELSGGQRQRVALARALAPEPKLLLLDEPFGAVDAKVREELRRWLRRMHDDLHVTSIFVTHDQEEAFALADRVVIIHNGHLEQNGAPLEILDNPNSEFVARFLGEVNVYDATVKNGEAWVGNVLHVPVQGYEDGDRLRLVVRAYDLKFWREDPGVATVKRVQFFGDRARVEAVMDDGQAIFSQFPRRSSLLKGVESGCRIFIEVTLARAYPVEMASA